MKAWGIALICALGFAGLVWWLPMDGTSALDRSFQTALGGRAGTEPVAALLALNGLGSTFAFGGVTLVAALLAWVMRFRKEAAALVLTVLVAQLLNTGLKVLFERDRPVHNGWISVDGYSFPSGNAMVGMALYGMLIVIVWSCARSGLARWGMAVIGMLLILLIGFSRLYVGVHYATDIIAGYVAGLFCVAAVAGLLRLDGGVSSRRRRSYLSFP
ncbi:phosphatase PAP2 family protein [Paenibacillus filicis]|uniref:Phosphatase PAP2 family protein n=1 Tax=Paenibacillus filicis TaxID=669464 RepID=A0ABU9DWK4_9BACL